MHRRITGKLVIATHNPGKLAEMRELLAPHGIEAISAGELGLDEPEETGNSFEANARIKAIAAAKAAQLPAFADDSGLAVDALNGAPGIYSARWAGPNKDFNAAMAQIERLLRECGATTPDKRGAHFVSALCVAWPDGHIEEVEARVEGAVDDYRKKLKERIDKLLRGSGVPLPEADLARELALFADRSDISEELQRLRSHVAQLRSALETQNGTVGRKLEFLAQELLGVEISVIVANTTDGFLACYGERELGFNLLRLGHAWFANGPTEAVDELLIHEFGHEMSHDHLSEEYHDALCSLGAKLKHLALTKPEAFKPFMRTT